MRLTLRTMLAYLDEILDADDALEIGKKIEESTFASGLVHRIRSSIRRLRLGAPKLEGKGMGLDPNTVAEYLDSTLPSDRVPDFEKVCLESDVHLAEVASCHQILALVLGEPADVGPATRERMYRVGTLPTDGAPAKSPAASDQAGTAAKTGQSAVSPAAAGTAASGSAAAAATTPKEKVARAKPEIPDYLLQSRRKPMWPLAITVVVAFVLAAVALLAMGPLNSNHPLLALFSGGKPQEVATGPEGQPAQGDTKGRPAQPAPANGKSGETVPVTPPVLEPDKGNGKAPQTVAPPPPVEPTVPNVVEPPAAPNPTVPNVGPNEPAAPVVPPAEPVVPPPATVTPPDTPTPGDSEVPKPTTPQAPVDMGRYISVEQALLYFDPKTSESYRLPPNASLSSGQRLLVLPTYRPQFVLTSGIQVTLANETSLQLRAPDARGVPGLAIEYGRALLSTPGKAGVQIGLQFGGRSGIATFGNADSVLAVEVRRYRQPGSDPESETAHTIVNLWTINGQIGWEESGQMATIDAGHMRLLVDQQPGRTDVAGELPEWIISRSLTGIDRIASLDLETKLVLDRSIVLTLLELLQDRKVEVRALAVRCLSYLDYHEPAVKMLNDETMKSYWPAQYDAFQDALARSPQSAVQVRMAFERERKDDGPALYRLLWSYSPQQLETGGAAQIVDYLDHTSMDFRVLAFINLWRITGSPQLYRPEQTEVRRKTDVRRWRDRLKEGTIVYKTPPTLIPSRVVPEPPPPADTPAPALPAPGLPVPDSAVPDSP
jgi:hypothetical protein